MSGDPHVGLVLADRYRLDALLGEGAMGAVYRGSQTTLNKPFAIKILHPHLTHDPDSHARFANEAHNAASLNHPNVVSVVDYGRTPDNITYIVMELVEGKSLEAIIQEEFPLGRDRIIDLTVQILAALTEAHGLGILHRDLKPENILVQSLRTHGELLKVLDFGIAKLMEDSPRAAARPGLTSQGMVCGTPEYMSPEQSRGLKLDGRSDLYAVGVILYQMLTGRVPFDSESAVEILHKHIHEAPIPPSQILGIEPDALEAVCLKAMSKDRGARFATAAEFRDALVAAGRSQEPQSVRCTACGSSIRTGDKFCSECGVPAPALSVPPPPAFRGTRASLSAIEHQGHRAEESTARVVIRGFPLALTGREELIEAANRRLTSPAPGLVTQAFRGPSGAGKTRLLKELASLAESRGWRVHAVGAEPSGAAPPLWPIRRLVGDVLELETERVRTQDLGRAANLVGLSFEALPGLAELFRLEGPANDAEYAVRRRECLAATVQALMAGGRGSPLLLILDDLDLYDSASRRVVQRLCQAQTDRPVLLLLASTERDLSWTGAPATDLTPLIGEQIEGLVRQAAGPGRSDSELPARLAATGPLMPLQLEHELRLLAGDQELPQGNDVGALLEARLAGLERGDRRMLEVGSVLGVAFDEQDLIRVMATQHGAPSGWDVDEALARLHVAGLLMARRRGERSFAHRQIRDHLYERLDNRLRRELHLVAAKLSVAAEHDVTIRAMHLLRAGHPDVVDCLSDAAESATASFDDRKAASLLRAAIRACAVLPGAERAERESALTVRLTEVLRFVGQADAAVDQARHILGASGNGAHWEVHRALGRSLSSAGRHAEAAQAFQTALGATIALGDPGVMLGIYAELGSALARDGQEDRARKELEEGLDMCTLGEGPRASIGVSMWRYLLAIARLYKQQGDMRRARTWTEHALWQAEQGAEELGMMRCHAEMAWLLRDLDQSMLGEQHLARALDHARYFGDRLTTAEILIERGRVRAANGQLEDARRFLDEARRLAAEVDWRAGTEHAATAIKQLERHASQH